MTSAIRTGTPPGHAEIMLDTYNLLLGARRLITHHQQQRATEGRDDLLDRGWRQVDRLAETRDRWALETSAAQPPFWITAYTQLLMRTEQARDIVVQERTGTGPGAGSGPRSSDTLALDRAIEVYRSRLTYWLVRELGKG